MFRFLRELFKGESLVDQSFHETIDILGVAKLMMAAAGSTLRDTETGEVGLDVRKSDKKINKYQREVRRNILTHLAVSSSTDSTAALVLSSIIIDVERIGDYTKNIVELAQAHPRRLKAGRYEDDLQKLEERVRQGFDEVRQALETSDEKAARRHMKSHREFAALADKLVEEIIAGDDELEKGAAVTLALYTRYLKRSESHLTNIISSVVNPFPRIGFRSKSPNSGADSSPGL
jgi:phosphate transport system protein